MEGFWLVLKLIEQTCCVVVNAVIDNISCVNEYGLVFFIFLPFFWVFLFSILMGKRIGRAIFADNSVVKPLRFYWLEANFAFFYELILYVRNLITSEKKNKTWKTKTKKPRAKKKIVYMCTNKFDIQFIHLQQTNNYNTKWLLLQSQVL